MQTDTHKGAYDAGITERQVFLREAKLSARLTTPSIFPDSNDARQKTIRSRALPKPSQSLGARGVRNITSKLLLTLFPTNGSFVRYELAANLFDGKALAPDEEQKIRGDLLQQLARREQALMLKIQSEGYRVKLHQALNQLIVAGNALLYMAPDGGMRVFPLSQYVVRRDFLGNLLELVYVEVLDRASIDPKIREQLVAAGKLLPTGEDDDSKDQVVELYTRVLRKGKKYHASQQAMGLEIEGKTFSVDVDKAPWLVLRFVAIDGEDYGHSFVEEFHGDLHALEDLRKALVVAAKNAAKLVPVLAPNSTMTVRQLTNAANGTVLRGRAEDLTFVQQGKFADMQVAQAEAARLERALAADFLLNSSVSRDAERVTREEIRLLAEELQDTFGGVYSILTQDMQLPFAARVEAQMIKDNDLEALPEGTVAPTVVAGLAALGRGHELQKIRDTLVVLREADGTIPGTSQHTNPAELNQRIWNNSGVDTTNLLRSADEIAEEQRQAQQQLQLNTIVDGAGPAAGKAGVEAISAASPVQQQQLVAAASGAGGN